MQNFKLFLNKPMIRKPLHTFWQAAGAVFVVGWFNVLSAFQNGGLQATKAAGLALVSGALAAGLSALKTAYVTSHQ